MGHTMLDNKERHQIQTLMLLGDGTHSKGDPDSTLDFYTKSSSVGEDGEKPKFHAQQAVIQKKEEK